MDIGEEGQDIVDMIGESMKECDVSWDLQEVLFN